MDKSRQFLPDNRRWPVFILGAVLCGCSKTPPNTTAPPPNPGSAVAVSPPAAPAASSQADVQAQTEADSTASESAASSNAKPTNAGVRENAQSTSLEKNALMAALFPGWKPTAGGAQNPGSSSTEDVPAAPGPAHLHVDHLEGASGDDAQGLDFEPDPWRVVRLDELHAVLITEAEAGWTAGAGQYDLIGAYFFTSRDGVWHLSKHNDVATWASANQSNKLDVESWPAHGFVLSLVTENGEQGANSSQVGMTLLTPDDATHLLSASLAQSDTGSGHFEDELNAFKDGISCEDLESDNFKLPPKDTLLQANAIDCHSAAGHWSFDGDLIHFNYEGVGRKVDADGNPLPLQRWKSVVTYRWENHGVKLIEGKDPEFGY